MIDLIFAMDGTEFVGRQVSRQAETLDEVSKNVDRQTESLFDIKT